MTNSEKDKKLISVISPCFNEKDNIKKMYERVAAVMELWPQYNFEYIFIDNASTDGTTEILRAIAKEDCRVKVIINARNFGHIRSPYWGLLNTDGDATIYLASDLQDPPELISTFLEEWQSGCRIVLAAIEKSETSRLTHLLRKLYYNALRKISDVPIVRSATGFGLYDKTVLDVVREVAHPRPFFRGLICELGFEIKIINFKQPRRTAGLTKNNFYQLYDYAMLGIISHSMVPIRIASLLGFAISALSIVGAMLLILIKLIFWSSIPLGYALLTVAFLLVLGLLMCFVGILGEYIGAINIKIQNLPIVIEKERINF